MFSLATEDVAVPGDILCMVMRQNVGQGQTIMGQANYSWYFWCYCFAFFLKYIKISKIPQQS